MTPTEVAKLLAVCASLDLRTVGDTDVLVWHEVIGDLTFADARAAVIAFHREETSDRLKPAHIRARVAVIRKARRNAVTEDDLIAGLDSSDGGRFAEQRRARLRLVMDGVPLDQAVAQAARALTAGGGR